MVHNYTESMSGAVNKAFEALKKWESLTDNIKVIRAAVSGDSPVKFRVLIITNGDTFDESVAEALDELSFEVHELLKETPFRFRFYLQPESTEGAAVRTFIASGPQGQPDELEAAETK